MSVLLCLVMENIASSLTTSDHLGQLERHQNSSMKKSCDWKNYLDFQWDILWDERWGYFENVQWMFWVKESICVQPLIKGPSKNPFCHRWRNLAINH